ncbi:hypothetical protein D3C71_2239090 [compost metagenome]
MIEILVAQQGRKLLQLADYLRHERIQLSTQLRLFIDLRQHVQLGQLNIGQ